MSEKKFYNNYEYQDDYEMRCDCRYDYDEEKKADPCDCRPEGNCCNGVTFDDPVVNKDVILSVNEVFDNKLTCSIPTPDSLAAVTIGSAVTTIIIQRYVPIEDCGCKSCEPLTIDDSAVYKVEKATLKVTRFFFTEFLSSGNVLINGDPINDLDTDDIIDTAFIRLFDLETLAKDTCDKRCKGTKANVTVNGLRSEYFPILELCGTVYSCGRRAKFFITVKYPLTLSSPITTYIPEVCIPCLEAFEKPYLELSGRLEAMVLGKPTVTVASGRKGGSHKQCLPELEISSISFLLRGVVQSKVVVPVQRLIQSKGLFIPDNFESCCNIPNVYPSQVEDNC